MSMAFVMQSEVLVHAVARVPEAFMMQTEAVSPSAEDCVAAGSYGSSRSFGRGSCGGSVEAVGSLEESQVVFCVIFFVRALTSLSSACNSIISLLDDMDLEKVPLILISMYLFFAMITSSLGVSVKIPS